MLAPSIGAKGPRQLAAWCRGVQVVTSLFSTDQDVQFVYRAWALQQADAVTLRILRDQAHLLSYGVIRNHCSSTQHGCFMTPVGLHLALACMARK